jgi:hypothetical protein
MADVGMIVNISDAAVQVIRVFLGRYASAFMKTLSRDERYLCCNRANREVADAGEIGSQIRRRSSMWQLDGLRTLSKLFYGLSLDHGRSVLVVMLQNLSARSLVAPCFAISIS